MHPIYQVNINLESGSKAIESQISSSVPLQQLLYMDYLFAFPFAVLFLFIQIFRSITQYNLTNIPLKLILCVIIIILHIFRLMNGYSGNLRQSFPEILAFFILTLISSVLMIVLLAYQNQLQIPIESSLLIVQLIIQFSQLIVCIKAMSSLSDAQTTMFFWRNPINTLKAGRKH